MELEAEIEHKVSRKPHTFRFRVLGDTKLRERSALSVFSEIKTESISWLWYPYIPLGRLTMLGGDPGAGKSFITTALASGLSKGEALPGEAEGTRGPLATLMLSAEDDPGDTIKPRLSNMNADQTKIYVSTDDIILDELGLKAIREMIVQTKAKLVIIDPIVAFLGPKVDMNRANEVRHIMKGISSIARQLDVAIVVVRHNRKSLAGAGAGKAIYAGMGSIDFTASVRSELAVTESKNGKKFLNHIKTNSGKQGQSITYEILEQPDGTGLFRWGDIVNNPGSEIGRANAVSRRFAGEAKAAQWLFDLLKNYPDGLSFKDIMDRGKLSGYSQTKLEHVKKGIVVSAKRTDGWYWVLNPNAHGQIETADPSVIE